MNWLLPGPARPDPAALGDFLDRAGIAADARSQPTLQLRWIGLDAPTTRSIFDLIRRGDKTGTFTLLRPFALTVSDDMPFWAERFIPVFDTDA